MKSDWSKHVALALTIALGGVSCSSSTNVAEGGIGGSGISMGSVSAVGSIWVNGVHFETTGANVYEEGAFIGTDAATTPINQMIGVGMVVTVRGTINTDGITGTAVSVNYADNLEGPITAITPNTVVVLGQTVIIDNLTKDENGAVLNDASRFSVGGWVEVSGFVGAGGSIHATYIENIPPSSEVELKGTLTIIDSTHFTIGGLTVVVADTSGLSDGDYVAVKGLYTDLIGNTLTAGSVERMSAVLDTVDYDEAEMEGIVSGVVVPETEFYLGSQRVRLGSEIEFNGGLATDIVPGVRLEVEGSFTSGVLVAKEVSFEDGIELEGNLVAVDGLTLGGMPGIVIEIDDVRTVFEGVAASSGELAIGQHVKIRGRATGENTIFATRIESSGEMNDQVVLQGPLQAADPVNFTVAVLGITAGGISEYAIDSFDGRVEPGIFFSTVMTNDLVELQGHWYGSGQPVWSNIELDD